MSGNEQFCLIVAFAVTNLLPASGIKPFRAKGVVQIVDSRFRGAVHAGAKPVFDGGVNTAAEDQRCGDGGFRNLIDVPEPVRQRRYCRTADTLM